MFLFSVIAAFIIELNYSGTFALKITKLSVPKVIDVRQKAVFTCNFDLENSKLYSVKWYKDDFEFCRFMPDGHPKIQVFNVEGVHLDMDSCNLTTVVLKLLDFKTSGYYICEVSTEAPYFKTIQTAANMTVWGIPQKNPAITGLQNVYAVGDYVKGNCTSDASHPFSKLDWYINDNQVEAWQLEEYPEVKVDFGRFQLKRTILGISFQADHGHFAGKGNTMVLKCVARMKDIHRQTVHISKLADLDVEKFAQGLYRNDGIFVVGGGLVLWVLCAFFILGFPLCFD